MKDTKTKTAAPPVKPPRRPRVGVAMADEWDARGRQMTDLLRQLDEALRQTQALLARLRNRQG